MDTLRCHGCGIELPRGSLKYIIEVKSFADFDGYLEDYDGDVEEGINELLDAMESEDVDGLEEDVCHDVVYILCKRCRDRFIHDPFHTGRSILEREDVKGTIH